MMGLLDCVASPEERDKFDESERPFPKPAVLSRSDHDISRRRGLPLFASQASLKNIRDVDFWRTRALRFLFSPEGREDIRVLKIPLRQLGYSSVTDFIADIPHEIFSEYLNQIPPDVGIVKDDKVFWVRDGIAEPGMFKWQGIIDNESVVGLQLDRKKAVPYGIYDGKKLFYCKPGHRALVPELEIITYKRFLRSFLGLPPRQDSLVGMRDSVRFSAKAIAAKNKKPGERVYLPKEKKWATVQWIGKIENETVVDLVYDPPKPEAGKPVSPDEPCASRSISLADFIGELNSEPNTPISVQPLQQQPRAPAPTKTNESSPHFVLPEPPSSPLPDSSDESVHSSDDDDSSEDDSGSDDNDDDSASETEHSESNASVTEAVGEKINMESENKMETSSITRIHVLPNDENENFEVFQAQHDPSPKLPSPKRKGFFKFSPNKKQKRPKSTTDLVAEEKSEFVSMPELQHTPTISRRSRNSNLFASWGFKKNPKLAAKPKEEKTKEEKPEKVKTPQPPPRKKPGLSSSWGALFKSKSKTQLQKINLDESMSPEECSTPIDEMVPPDNIPTPPPFKEQPQYNERRVDRPEFLNLPTPPPDTTEDGEEVILESEKLKGEVSLCPVNQSSEDETSESEEEEGQSETQQISVDIDMHAPPPLPLTPIPIDTDEEKIEDMKPTQSVLESQVQVAYHEDAVEATANEQNEQTVDDHNDVAEVESPPYIPTRSLERFKETRVRNRPSSFGSFLARIKNLKPNDDENPTSPIRPVSPPPILKNEEIKEHEMVQVTQEENKNLDRKNSMQSDASHSSTDVSDGKTNAQEVVSSEFQVQKSLVKPKIGVQDQTATENGGNQEEIVLELLDVQEPTPPVNSPPPVPSTDPPRRRPSRNKSFTFSFSKKRKPSHPQTPTTPREDLRKSAEDVFNHDNTENIDPAPVPAHKQKENDEKEKKLKTNSFRNSFRRTFSLTRSKKRTSLEGDSEAPSTPPTPKSRISKPRPVTMYIDNNEVTPNQSRTNSFRNKRPTSLFVDIKPWNMRHGRDRVDIYSSPSSDEAGKSPGKSPNPALLPKEHEANIPKHRIFTTPAFFYKRSSSHKGDSEPLVPKTKKSNKESISQQTSPETSPMQEKPPALPRSPSPPPADRVSEAPSEMPGTKLKSVLKQRKEIECIPKGLKVNDRVLWYSGKGPVPGTIQRLFKDGTDKYTAMVKFDREMKEEPLRLTREGDAYIVTVEELITPDMFEPTYANQTEIEKMKASTACEPVTPLTPSVRFNGLREDPVPNVAVTGGEQEMSEEEEHDLPPPFQQEEVTMACGFKRGIQCRDKSCCLETILFSMFYTTNAFDITMLYANSTSEDTLTRKVRSILRKEIVDPLRREGFCSWFAVKKLRDAVKPLSDEWQTMSTDAEVMMFILFDRALKLQKFISYSNEMSDFLHQLVVDTKDLSKSTTVQHLFETSLKMMDKLKLKTVPTPALILEMPRSNDKLMQYKAVIPNLSLTVSHILDGGPRLCICGAVAKHECKTCTANVGSMSIVYCDNCKSTADVIHFQLTHDAQLNPLNQPLVILDLSSIICVKGGHYFSFVKCGNEPFSPWVFFDGAELENPKVCIEQNLSMWLDRLEKYPGRYQDALQYPLLTHILQDSHICIYQPREKSSSV